MRTDLWQVNLLDLLQTCRNTVEVRRRADVPATLLASRLLSQEGRERRLQLCCIGYASPLGILDRRSHQALGDKRAFVVQRLTFCLLPADVVLPVENPVTWIAELVLVLGDRTWRMTFVALNKQLA